ncbi:MAG: hypothetical protein M1814_000610 [Vezdaea aestivalis]|nr:MAG: hypothetical protein M1814_000610 [Vezdaea aestivalis]
MLHESLGHPQHGLSPRHASHDILENVGRSVGRPERKSSSIRGSASTITPASLLLLAFTLPTAVAQSCISLSGSTACPAFNTSSISTSLSREFPFLSFVSNVGDFDDRIKTYIGSSFIQTKYQNVLGCSGIDLSNTSSLYARYTTSVLCNAIVQGSRTACSLSDANSRPLCADSCAQYAISEQQIVSMSALCSNPARNAIDQIRADFTVCALPSNSLSGSCISGSSNEVNTCGFADNVIGLCSYCAKSSPNATDSCCYNSNVTRCDGINIPVTSALPPLFPSGTSRPSASQPATASSGAATPGAGGSGSRSGLSNGQIAGIAIGSVVGAAFIAALLIALCLFYRRRKTSSQKGSVFNQPTPPRKGAPSMAYNPTASTLPQPGYEQLPGGRIARMSALEGTATGTQPRVSGSTKATTAGTTVGGIAAGIAGPRRKRADHSSSDDYGDSPESRSGVPLRAPPTGARHGSLSSASALGVLDDHSSPQSGSGGDYSSPMGVASQQSEQLPFFKDYYSQDEIHPNDKVSTLWAYQPRAGDEFELERGDMLKVVGIWDDGWATGVRITEKAEDWDAKRKAFRDSGVSHGGADEGRRRTSSPPPPGDIKAFPLVCVCLPDHWKKTIEGDGSTETTSSGPPAVSP